MKPHHSPFPSQAASSISHRKLVLGVHSLQQGRYGILIDKVELVIKQVTPVPQPLNTWIKGPPLIYNTNLYQVQYSGQPVGERLSALYVPVPYGHVQLAPGEADQLNIRISSQTTGTVQFFIQVTYRITNTSQRVTIALPNTFQVVFSDKSNWNEYQLQNGHFVI